MDFEGQYLTYEDYRYLGGTLDLMSFNLLEFEARKKIDLRTKNRIKGTNYCDIPYEVKLCMFKLMNKLNEYEKKESSKGISSETVGSYSVTYSQDTSENETTVKDKDLDDLMMSDLYGVALNGEHLIYLG